MGDFFQLSSLGNWFAPGTETKTYPSNDFRTAMLGMAQNYPAAAIQPPAPQGWDAPLPNISLNTLGRGRPRLDASLSVPAFGGQLGIEGNYQRYDNNSPASWAGKLGYSRSF
jgi:hypothetical protein